MCKFTPANLTARSALCIPSDITVCEMPATVAKVKHRNKGYMCGLGVEWGCLHPITLEQLVYSLIWGFLGVKVNLLRSRTTIINDASHYARRPC